jgi:NTP pyrophosphatase (non-canonical NTP hydrolase)
MGTTLVGSPSWFAPSPVPLPPAPIPSGQGGEGLVTAGWLMSDHLSAIVTQREANRERWKGYLRTPAEHLLILTEEVGEVARAMQDGKTPAGYQWPPQYNNIVYRELVDVGAVVLAMLEECGAPR